MSADLLKVIAVDHIRHEFKAMTPVAGKLEIVRPQGLAAFYIVEVETDNGAFFVGIGKDEEVFAVGQY